MNYYVHVMQSPHTHKHTQTHNKQTRPKMHSFITEIWLKYIESREWTRRIRWETYLFLPPEYRAVQKTPRGDRLSLSRTPLLKILIYDQNGHRWMNTQRSLDKSLFYVRLDEPCLLSSSTVEVSRNDVDAFASRFCSRLHGRVFHSVHTKS